MKHFFRRAWRTPEGDIYSLYKDMAAQPHLLVAGATGSGKSVVLNGIMHTLLHRAPTDVGFILIDPKRVELLRYARLPHVVRYATEQGDMVQALQQALTITDQRYKAMAREGLKKYNGSDLYVVIDELADLMTTNKRQVMPLLQRLCQIGRAASVHVLAATQCPIAKVIPTEIKVNFDSRVALRTECAQDSRNIMRRNGCELLPRYGQGYYKTPEGVNLWNIPMISESALDALCKYWRSRQCVA